MSSFFLPKQINVGFRNRSDTYTQKLAYIIYFDEKGKLRKETSWNGWRDKSIENQIYDNEPTSGFVLNKRAGGYDTGWNHRQTYVRVYDPRGFEFEITVQNLLYILENATSTKGKGLEGEFVYGWDGKELVLIPCDAPDYQELVNLNKLRHAKNFVKAKELKIGATYRTKNNEELIYMGKFEEYDWSGKKDKKPSFWFYKRNEDKGYFERMKTISQKFVEVISDECVSDYAEIFDMMERNSSYSPIDESKSVYVPFTIDEVRDELSKRNWFNCLSNFDNENNKMERQEIGIRNDKYYYHRRELKEFKPTYSWTKPYTDTVEVKCQVDTLEEVFEIVKPMVKEIYLANGKFYDRSVYY